MKLELKHLAPYLPYGLKLKVTDKFYKYDIMTLCDKSGLSNIGISEVIDDIDSFKPILVPLSDFKNINSRQFAELDWDIQNQIELCDLANKEISFASLSVDTYNLCLINHIDIFGLIDNKLAIDANTL
jgi:hypothetical protein